MTFGGQRVERETGFEPATSTLARSHSTTELFPPDTMMLAAATPPVNLLAAAEVLYS